jgi:inner membrane protease subunit 1
MIQVPEGHCWVVGDNIPYSRDSRHFGPLPMGLVRGKVLAVVFPWRERRWIGGDLHPVQD